MQKVMPQSVSNAEAERSEASVRDRALIGLAAAGVALPPIVDLLWNGWQRVFGYFAGDAFCYFDVARNIASGLGASFDGEHTTNGFHPLWQAYTALLYSITSLTGLGEPAFLVGVFLSSLLLIVAATVLIGNSFRLALGRVPAAFPILPLGLYALSAGSLEPHYGTLWSFANGMETGATLAAFAWALYCMVKREQDCSLGTDLQLGLALSALLLSRLDHAALAVCVLAVYALRRPRRSQSRFLELAPIAGPFVFTLSAYLLFNWWSVGTPLPVSGAVKSSFPESGEANLFYLRRIIYYLEGAREGEIWRMAQMLLPAVIALFSLPCLAALIWRKKHDALSWPFVACSAFSIVLTVHNFLFVNAWHQGHWYYPVSITMMTLLAFYFWEKARPLTEGRGTAFVASLSAVSALLYFSFVVHDARYNKWLLNLYQAREEITEHFSGTPPKIIEYDDGIVSFTTGFSAMSGLGFVIDLEAIPWFQNGRILWLAYDRGFDHIVSLSYFGTGDLNLDSSSDEIREKLNETFFLTPDATAPFDFQVVYVTSKRQIAFIRIQPSQPPTAR